MIKTRNMIFIFLYAMVFISTLSFKRLLVVDDLFYYKTLCLLLVIILAWLIAYIGNIIDREKKIKFIKEKSI